MKIQKRIGCLLYGCWMGVLLLGGCSQSQDAKEVALEQIAVTDEQVAVTELEEIIEQAEAYYEEGVEHYKHHRWESAHHQFDQALEMLLEADMDAETHYRLTETYDKLFAQIHKLELEERYREGLAKEDVREEAENSDELEAFLSTTRPEFLVEEESSSTSIFENPEGTLGEITIDESDELVMKYVKEFTKDHSQYRKGMERAAEYLPMILPIFKANKLPVELTFIPLIESNFRVDAVSPAGAVGLWQFVRSTGKNYDLQIDSYVDERRDPKKASEAAAKYLGDLYGMLGDWELAFAGYYMGEYKVHNAIGRHRTRDIEELAETRAFGSGAKHYVARIKAAIFIAKHAEQFGLSPLEIQPVSSVVVDVKRGSDLKHVAKQLGISYEELRHLNPELKQGKTPAGSGKYALRIPKSTESVVLAQQMEPSVADEPEEMATPAVVAKKTEIAPSKSRAKTSEEYLIHRVRKGENPSTIAKKYKVSVEDIRRANNIRNVKSLQVGQKLKIPTSGKRSVETAKATKKTISHTIRKGDTLASIAEQYHVDVETLKSFNRIKKANRLQIGQIIKVPAKSTKVASAKGASSDKKMRTYRVKRGDSLSKIAASFGVSVSQLQQWNNFDSGTLLYPGSRITVWY